MAIQITADEILHDGVQYGATALEQAADLTALKALTGMDNGEIRLLPSVGLFHYDSASAATADDVTIVAPTSGTGRWLLVGSESAQYGALAIQQAADFTALRALTGMLDGDVRLVPGKGLFYFDDDNGATDDGVNAIEPSVGAGAWIKEGWDTLCYSFVWDPGNLVDGAGETSIALTCSGAALGDFVMISAPYNTQGILVYGWVSAADTVLVRLQNETGGAIDLASGTWQIRIFKLSNSTAVP